MRNWFYNLFYICIDWIFPPRKTEKTLRTLTKGALDTFPPTQNQSNPLTYSLFSYKHPQIKALIWELKYYKNKQCLEAVAPLLAEQITDECSDRILFENWQHIYFVPVPTSNVRRKERGFSHTELMCTEILKHISPALQTRITYKPSLLSKIRHTTSQSKIDSREKRLTQVIGSQKADTSLVHTLLSDTHIILIDDVTTTGATLSESRRALETCGIPKEHIIAFTIAH